MNSYQQPQPGKAPRRFFTWVRSSGLIRGNDRWIGGVCSGIAQRLGWSPTLVRALMIVATLFFGFGAALYAMGWFLIPDVRSGQILAEDLIEGQWDWNCLGCFLFMAVAVLIPGAGWVCIALAALVLWLIAQSGVRQQEGYGFGYHGGQSTAPPNNPNGPNNPNNLAPNPSMQPSAAMPPYVSQPVSQSVPYVSQPVPQAGQRPYNPTSSSAAMPVDGIPAGKYAMPNPVAAAAPRSSTRRKPAGPVVVLSVLGLSFISFAAVMAVIWEYDMDVSGIVRVGTIWISAVCVVMGLIVVVLGFKGRRAGGLIPLGLMAGACAMCMIIASGTYAIRHYDATHTNISYTDITLSSAGGHASVDAYGMNQVQVNDQFYADSSQRTFDKLVRGVWFSGDDYDSSQAVLDLSDWESSHAPHKLELSNGNTSISNCPAGTITISAVQAQVHIILPDGCSYGIGSAWRGYTYGNSMGGKYAVIYDTVNLIGFSDTDQGHSIDSYDTNYAWMTDDSKMPANGPELLVDIPFSAGARVNMTYISDWEGSTYMQFRNNFDTTNGYTEDSGKAE